MHGAYIDMESALAMYQWQVKVAFTQSTNAINRTKDKAEQQKQSQKHETKAVSQPNRQQ